jgi:hypothetical protein
VLRICVLSVLASFALIPRISPAAGPPPNEPVQKAVSTAIDASIRKDVLNKLARALESQYAIEDTAKKLAELVRARQKANAYKRISTAPELARALTEDLYAVAHDKHLHVDFSFTPLPEGPSGPPSPDVLNAIAKQNGAIPKLEILDGNVGYMRVNGVPFIESARSAIAAAFEFLRNTDALIIDNRGNGGGDPNTVALYVSYLSTGEPYVVNTFHWRAGNRIEEFKTTQLGDQAYGADKPVFVLTSPFTFSGGEELSYDLQAEKRAVVVGEVTGGGANPGGPVPLPHQFVVFMPGAVAVNPLTKTSWEGIGVKPDVGVPFTAALGKAHELAIERLMTRAADPMSRAALRAVAMKLESVAEAESAGSTRLSNAQIVGTYALEAGSGASLTILEKEGRLIQHMDGLADVALIFVKGNRYQREGRPDGSITSFRLSDGNTELLLEGQFRTPSIRQKQ